MIQRISGSFIEGKTPFYLAASHRQIKNDFSASFAALR
jgi:hypothetical protein